MCGFASIFFSTCKETLLPQPVDVAVYIFPFAMDSPPPTARELAAGTVNAPRPAHAFDVRPKTQPSVRDTGARASVFLSAETTATDVGVPLTPEIRLQSVRCTMYDCSSNTFLLKVQLADQAALVTKTEKCTIHFKDTFVRAWLRTTTTKRQRDNLLFAWNAAVNFGPMFKNASHWLRGHGNRRQRTIRTISQLQHVFDTTLQIASNTRYPGASAAAEFLFHLFEPLL